MSGQVSGTGKKTCLDKAGLQMATNGMDRVGLEMDGAAHSLNNGSGSKMDDSNLPAWRRPQCSSPHKPFTSPRHRPPRPGQPSTRLGHNEGVRLVEVPPSLTGSLQQWEQAPCLPKANRKSRGDACLAFQKKRKSCQNTCGEQTPRAQAPSLHKAVPLWGQTPCLQKAVKVQWPQCCISWPVC